MKEVSGKSVAPFHDGQSGCYFMELQPGRFMRLSAADCRLHLRRSGLRDDEYKEGLNQLEFALAMAQVERGVDYAGPLAGHNSGSFQTPDGRRILVTASPQLPTPKRGKWPWLRRFFDELLAGEQDYLLAWLAVGFESLAQGTFAPGQLLVLAGEAGCGKSLCQSIITQCLGGRVAKPYQFMVGETAFNGDLAQAEHWCIEDEHGSTDIRTRRKFGTSIKDVTANLELRVHRKGAQGISLPTFRRLTLSVNKEPENLQIVPPLDASLSDKIMLLSCSPADVGPDRVKTWKAITNEVPALLWHLVNEFTIPPKERCPRYGVKAFHSPSLAEILSSVSPETRLLSLIDEVLFTDAARSREAALTGTTEQVERWLRSSAFNFAVEKLLYFSSACGVYLARLSVKNPDRVKIANRANGRTTWLLSAP